MMNRASRLTDRLRDDARFFRAWMDSPARMGSVIPSSSALARKIAVLVDPACSEPVLELGSGTGPVTRAILERGLAPEKLVTIEYDAHFVTLLKRNHPAIRVVKGDAYDLHTALPEKQRGPFSIIVSGLPLLTRPLADRIKLLQDAFSYLTPEGIFIQFSYSFMPPVRMHDRHIIQIKSSTWVVRNFPPARIWTYQRAAEQTAMT